MRFRIIEELENGRNVLCPYVVCETCDVEVRKGEKAVVIRAAYELKGDVQPRVYHDGKCDPGGGLSRSLDEWMVQISSNSL